MRGESQDFLQKERRLYYVGMPRAAETQHFFQSGRWSESPCGVVQQRLPGRNKSASHRKGTTN